MESVGNLKGQALAEVEFLVGFRLIFGFLWGPSKCNAQAARCTGGVKINGWDRISLHQNLENQSKPYSHLFPF